jgi:hypothetical protein
MGWQFGGEPNYSQWWQENPHQPTIGMSSPCHSTILVIRRERAARRSFGFKKANRTIYVYQ